MSAAPALQELLNGQQINYHKLHLKQFATWLILDMS